jgi:tetratricopeptide (TPR) repeat protein
MNRVAKAVCAVPVAVAVMLAPMAATAQSAAREAPSKPATRKAADETKAKRKAKPKAKEKADAAKPVDPEQTLDEARRALASGKAEAAASLAQRVIESAKKDHRATARALAVRGEARLKSGRIAEAMADLDNALWVAGGLAATERDQAVAARAEAYRQAGLPEPGAVLRAEAPAKARVDAAPAAPAARSASGQEAASAGLGAVGGFFSNLFSSQGGDGSGDNAAPRATASVPAARPAATSSSEPQRAGAAEASAVATGPAVAKGAAVAKASAPASAASGAGGFRLQLAPVRSESEAAALADAVRKAQPDVLRGRRFDVEETVFGNMGRFYRVRIGRFATRVESEAVCASLRSKGHDCMVIDG